MGVGFKIRENSEKSFFFDFKDFISNSSKIRYGPPHHLRHCVKTDEPQVSFLAGTSIVVTVFFFIFTFFTLFGLVGFGLF